MADLYCGAGTISLMLAKKARHVVGIEIVPEAIQDAKENARRNGVEKLSHVRSAPCQPSLWGFLSAPPAPRGRRRRRLAVAFFSCSGEGAAFFSGAGAGAAGF